jgi:transposase
MQMIVIGADPHKSEHTAAAVCRATGELRSSETVAASPAGHLALLEWGRELNSERVWALEDCRHVSGGLERFLVEHGEHVVRVPPKLMGESRRAERSPGKSDAIDAVAVARAALRQGVEDLPAATVDQAALEIKLLADHREDLVAERTRVQNRLRWHLHELWPELTIPVAALDRAKWLDRVGRRLARAQQSARVRVCRDELRRLRELTRSANALERELATLVARKAPALLELEGCGPLSAARILAECGDASRFASDAKLARLAGVAPIPASSGNRQRHRLHRGGNRKLNCAIHRIAVTQGRVHGPARDYLERKQAEGKTRLDALRCLKRQLVRRLWHLLQQPLTPTPSTTSIPATRGIALT